MESMADVAEEIVHEALSHHYPAFNAQPDSQLVIDIVALLNDPSKRQVDGSFESAAAFQVRRLLLDKFTYGVSSVKTVVRIFKRLNRENELGWLVD